MPKTPTGLPIAKKPLNELDRAMIGLGTKREQKARERAEFDSISRYYKTIRTASDALEQAARQRKAHKSHVTNRYLYEPLQYLAELRMRIEDRLAFYE